MKMSTLKTTEKRARFGREVKLYQIKFGEIWDHGYYNGNNEHITEHGVPVTGFINCFN